MILLYKPSTLKKVLAFAGLALSLLLSASCKKNVNGAGDPGPYYVKFKISGVQKNLTTVSATADHSNGYYTLLITGGGATTATNAQALVILLNSTAPITANSQFTSDFVSGISGQITYNDNATKDVFSSSYANITAGTNTLITITEITANEVKGTFSGKMFDAYDLATAKATVTEGQFYAKLH